MNKYTFCLAQRVTGAAGVAGNCPCKWFTALRAPVVSLGYPNFTDASSIGRALNMQNTTDALTGTTWDPLHATIDTKYYSTKYREMHTVTNVATTQMDLYVYWLEARRDIPFFVNGNFESYSILDWLANGLGQATVVSTETDGIDSNPPTPYHAGPWIDTNNFMVDGALTPFHAPAFLRRFRVRRSKRIHMLGGQIVKIHNNVKRRVKNAPADYKLNMIGADTWVYNQSQATTCFVKGARFVLFKMKGQAVNSAAVATEVNLSVPSVDLLTECSFSYQAQLKTGGVTFVGATYGLTTVTAPEFVSIVEDAVETPAIV